MLSSIRGDNRLYDVQFYLDINGQSEIVEYLDKLAVKAKISKTNRSIRKKLLLHFRALAKYGTQVRRPTIKHIRGNMWQLQPLSNWTIFFYQDDIDLILLNHNIGKIKKATTAEVVQAYNHFHNNSKREWPTTMKKGIRTYTDYMEDESRVSPAEKEQIEFELSLIGIITEAREALDLTQQELSKISGIKQPTIARLERMQATIEMDLLFKLLTPLGYTIKIAPLKYNKKI